MDNEFTRDVMKTILYTRDLDQATAAEEIGWTADKMSKKLVRVPMYVEELKSILDKFNFSIQLIDNETGEVVKLKKEGHGPRVKGVSDGVRYNTCQSEFIASNFFEDGEHEYHSDGRATELYRDKDGRYFFAEYTDNPGERNRVRAVTDSVASAFIEKYGK